MTEYKFFMLSLFLDSAYDSSQSDGKQQQQQIQQQFDQKLADSSVVDGGDQQLDYYPIKIFKCESYQVGNH